MRYANTNIAMQFLEEDLRDIDMEVTATAMEIIRLGMVNPHVAMDIPHYIFTRASRKTLSSWALFLDSCTMYHLMFIKWYLTNIHKSHIHLKGHCNAGVLTCTVKGLGPI